MSNSVLPTLSSAGGKNNDSLPLPLIVAQMWTFPLAYVETEEGAYYAIQDWVKGLTGANDARHIWANMKRRNELFSTLNILDLCKKLPYVATDGKTYQCPYTTSEGLYRITQCMRSNNGVRNVILSAFTSGEIPDALSPETSHVFHFIYILRCCWSEYQNVYKIGRSRTANRRLADLDRQFPFEFEVVASHRVSDAKYVERTLHRRFDGQRVRNEWFRLTSQDLEDVLAFIHEHQRK